MKSPYNRYFSVAALAFAAALFAQESQAARSSALFQPTLGQLTCNVTGPNGPNQGPFLLGYEALINNQSVSGVGTLVNPQPAPIPSMHSSQICNAQADSMCQWTRQQFPTPGYYLTTSYTGFISYPLTIKVKEVVFDTRRVFNYTCL